MSHPMFSIMLANHWSYTGIGWQLGLESCVQSVEDSLNLSDRPPHIKVCLNLDAQAYRLIRIHFPETADRLQQYLKQGKVELVGGTFGQPMGSMVGNESNIRQILYGRKAIQQALDYEIHSFLEEEEFTFPQLPQLLQQTGYQYASLAQCDTWGNTGVPRFSESRIRWRAPDGTELPAATRTSLYFHPPMVTKDVTALLDVQKEALLQQCQKESNPLATVWTEFGWEPITSHTMNCFHEEYYHDLDKAYDLDFVTLGEYMENNALPEDPVYNIEYDQFHKLLPWGVGGDQIRVYDRKIESALLAAEKLNVMAVSLGAPSLQEEIDLAWEDLLVSQSHDVSLCEYTRWGGGVFPPADMVLNQHSQQWGALGYRYLDAAQTSVKKLTDRLTGFIGQKIRPAITENLICPLYVFHLTEYQEQKTVTTERVYFSSFVKKSELELVDGFGRQIEFSLLDFAEREDGSLYYVRIRFLATLPPMGYIGYYLVHGKGNVPSSSLVRETEECYILENDYIVGKISKKNGALFSLLCKETGEETLDSSQPFPVFFGQPSHDYPRWAQTANLPCYNSLSSEIKVEKENCDGVYGSIRSQFILEQVMLEIQFAITKECRGVQINCRIKMLVPPQAADGNINGWQLPLDIKDGYWFRFGHGIQKPTFFCDHPFANSPTRKKELHGLTYLDIVGERTGLLVTHSGTQYFKIEENRVENLILREWESHFTQQYGWPTYAEYSYLLTPHSSCWTANQKLKQTRFLDDREPIITLPVTEGALPDRHSFLEVKAENALLSSMLQNGDKVQLRFLETDGQSGHLSLKNNLGLYSCQKIDMLGNGLESVKSALSLDIHPWKIATYCFFSDQSDDSPS